MDRFVTWTTVAAVVMSVLAIIALVLRSRAWRGAERWWTFYSVAAVAAVVLWLGVLAGRAAPVVIDEMGLIFLGAVLLNLGALALIVMERRRSETRGVKYRGSSLVWGVFGVVGAVLLLRLIEMAAL